MSQVSYAGSRLIPAPLLTVDKTWQTTGDGRKIGSQYNITLAGYIIADMGSPTSSGTFWKSTGHPPNESIENDSHLTSLLRKAESLRELFAADGQALIIQPLDGATPVRCYPRLVNISFAEDIWYQRVPYTITLEADVLLPKVEDGFTDFLSSASENWSLETNEQAESVDIPRTYALTHTVEAVGKRHYISSGLAIPAWKQAQNWVEPRLGLDSTFALSSGVNNLPAYYTGWNHVRSQNVDEEGGSFSVTETWILASGSALEEFNVSTETSLEGITTVSVDGVITGLEERDEDFNVVTTKYDNASTKFAQVVNSLYARATTYSGESLNPVPRSMSIGRSPVLGTINYNRSYDNRASGLIPNALSEVISVEDSPGTDGFASHFVLGRSWPLLQDLSGRTEPKTRLLNIECVFSPPSMGDGSESAIRNVFVNNKPTSAVQTIISAVEPTGTVSKFINQNSESWDGQHYRFTRGWVYEI